MGVLADTGKNIQHLASVRFRVLYPVSRNNCQTKFRSQINERTIDAIFAAQKMPLNFDIHILAAKRLDEMLRAFFCILGRAGCQPAVCGSLPQTWNKPLHAWRNCVRQAAGRCRLAACAPPSKERNESLRKFRQLLPLHCALPFYTAAQMRLGKQRTKIGVAEA